LFQISLRNLPADKPFVAHVHKLACDETKGGGHYQNLVPPAGTPASDPKYANSDNEIWFEDLKTLFDGRAQDYVVKNFVIRPGEARSVAVHDGSMKPPPKRACIDVPF